MKVHFIAIGGSAMHNLAIALEEKGYKVTGSDDEIFEPSRTRLKEHGLLPDSMGWNPQRVTKDLDAVILGMHARNDNPELLKAQELGLKVFSYPEYLYEQTKNKTRVVIGGSHGKTTITSMIMHVLHFHHISFDYMVGAQVEGFETMVHLSEESRIAVFEGDEYLTSPIDPRPKFHLYHPNIALLSGIAWDHINVFPTFNKYVEQFRIFANLIEPNGSLIYFDGDSELNKIGNAFKEKIHVFPYSSIPSEIVNGKTFLQLPDNKKIPLSIFGDHNIQNINGARLVCLQLGISDEMFYQAISSFKGAARRLEVLAQDKETTVFYDFAHSPSKLKATIHAVKEQFPNRKLIACMELHTFSSLKKEFLPQYAGSMDPADEAFVYFNPHAIAQKKLDPITTEQVKSGFALNQLNVTTDADNLFNILSKKDLKDTNLLLMSSGTFSGKDLKSFAKSLINK